MQSFAKAAALASATCAATTVYPDDTIKIKNKSDKDYWSAEVSGSWDLLKNGSKYDMLMTFNMDVDFLSGYTPSTTTGTVSKARQIAFITCLDLDDYLESDHCWRVLASYSNGAWTWLSTMYDENDSIEDFVNSPGSAPPAGRSSEIIWEAEWDKNGKATTVKSNSDYKVYNELM